MYVCMYLYVFAIDAHAVMTTEEKFGMELGFHPEKFIANIRADHPHPQGRVCIVSLSYLQLALALMAELRPDCSGQPMRAPYESSYGLSPGK